VQQIHSSNRGQALYPEDVILIHLKYTGLASAKEAIQWYCTPLSRQSAHYVIGKDGHVVQLVAPRWVSWGCPKGSSWEGYTNLNQRSITIALDSLGPLYRDADGFARPIGSGIKVPNPDVYTGRHKFERASFTEWAIYPERQLAALDELTRSLVGQFQKLKAIVGSDDVSPLSHLAPGPALPARYLDLASYTSERT
jgi:N-acetylmuramoyl-L-alanine amidase